MSQRYRRIFGLSRIASIAFVLVSNSELSAQTDSGFGPLTIKDKAGSPTVIYQESHALVVGMGAYTTGWNRLPNAAAEVEAVKTVLEQHGFHVLKRLNPNEL